MVISPVPSFARFPRRKKPPNRLVGSYALKYMDSLKLGSGPNSCMYSSAGSRRRAMVHPIETPSGPPGARRNLCAMAPGDLSEQLSAALAPVLGPGVHVEDLTRAPGGASRE